jgi:hypothetical protein
MMFIAFSPRLHSDGEAKMQDETTILLHSITVYILESRDTACYGVSIKDATQEGKVKKVQRRRKRSYMD